MHDKKRGVSHEYTSLYIRVREELFLSFRNNKLIALSVDIDNLHRVIILQMLAQLGDIDIHAAGIKVVVINPD